MKKNSFNESFEAGELQIFKELLTAGADIKLTDKDGNTALKLIEEPFLKLITEKKVNNEDLNLLLEKGLNPKIEDKQGNNLIHLISKFGDESMLETAFKAGVDVYKKNKLKQTAFTIHTQNKEHGKAIKSKLDLFTLSEKDIEIMLCIMRLFLELRWWRILINSGMNIKRNEKGETQFFWLLRI